MVNEIYIDSIERDKNNEIFDRLLKFGIESDRPIFCQRLHTIWDEQGIFCQSYPTITNQILDFYKLYHLVQEKQGYLEITTNRGWKEISNVLGFGDSGSAAYSVKRNYVRLGLLAYECRFDRAGIDPRSVIELSEMPHTVKKRKRGNNNNNQTSATRAIVKANKQQLQMLSIQHEHNDEVKHSPLTPSIDNHKYSQQISIHDLQNFPYILRAGYLGDSNKYLDTLLIWLSDQRTSSYFNLKYLPGLFNSIMEQYIGWGQKRLAFESKQQLDFFSLLINPNNLKIEQFSFIHTNELINQIILIYIFYLACLYELFGQSLSTNDHYINWSNFQINEIAIGPQSNSEYLESLFYGTYRYVIKQIITSDDKNNKEFNDRYYSIIIRCSCLTTIIRNLSFIEENEFLANDHCLLDILERILNFYHDEMHEIYDYEISSSENFLSLFTKTSIDLKIDHDYNQQYLMYLLDNTFITLSNLSIFINLNYCHSIIRYRLINTIIHWIVCSLSFANNKFISMIMEDKKNEEIFISPRQICLQIFAKLCTNEHNVDIIIQDFNFKELKFFFYTLLSIMNSINIEDINREYCLIIICSFCKRNQQLVKFFASKLIFIELIFNYLELYEYNQQQYLIATLTSCYQISSIIPMNYSIDMMIDSCIQLLKLIALIKEKNYLKLFEYKLVDMLSSIYFEQKILKDFADILFLIQS